MKTQKHIQPVRALSLLSALVFVSSLHASEPTTVVTDAVENATDWTRIVTNTSVNNSFVTGKGSLAPTAGTYFYVGGNMTGSGMPNRGLARYFSGKTLQAGIYTVTFDIGRLDTATIPDFTTNFTIDLLADTNSDGNYAYSERLAGAITGTVNPSPAAGTWATWTYTFTVDADTLSAAGNSVVGSTLGFLIVSAVPNDSGFAFDNLSIAYTPPSIPEPASVALILGLGGLAFAGMRARRRR